MAADPARARDLRLRRLYGITADQYDLILIYQGGACAVCRRPPTGARLHVDHDHKTGLIRGLLCWFCNSRVVGNREPDQLRRAADYLDTPPAVAVIGEVYGPIGRITNKKRKRRKPIKR